MEEAPLSKPDYADKVAEIERLTGEGVGIAATAKQVGVCKATVKKYRKRTNGEGNRSNGHANGSARDALDLAGIERLLADRWNRLSLAQKLDLMLPRA
jgi:hypothetical protein